MTYAELQTAIKDYLQNTETTFVNDLDTIIKQGEERILKIIRLPVFRKNVTGTLTDGNTYLSTPSDFMDDFSLAVISSSNYIFLLRTDVSFIREAYPNSSTKSTPKHYALFDDTNFIVGPTPDADYTAELHYFYRPNSITAGASDGTTWLSTNASNALLYACLLEGYVYMKGEPDLLQVYDGRYKEALARLKNLGEAENISDSYREGTFRVPQT
jgi:hypothetical protein|tara:strand:- start:981 stop:1622 length:642 start_codon:yes stop_codon:yes gene_type:complete